MTELRPRTQRIEEAGPAGGARLRGDAVFAADFRAAPYWHAEMPPAPALPQNLPPSAEVVVIGSGYTGLHAALQTARGGRATVVLEAGDPGWGCSTRNGGHISGSVKPSLADLARRVGPERARRIRAEGIAALDWIGDFVAAEGIDCAFRRSGRFHAAHTPERYEALARAAETVMREEGIEAHAVPRSEQRGELGTGFYHGGVVYPRFATLHPARYHRGLLMTALASGVQVVPHCAALSVTRRGQGFEVATALGPIAARDVVVATNGYTSALTPWLRRRVIPIGSYVIATEPLPPGTVQALFPTGRIASDTRRVVYYYGPSPDRRRVVFGGRVSAGETDPRVSGPRLHAEMARIFPELAAARISHSWSGTVAYTFDQLAHCGVQEGIHYSLGYCGSGVAMSSWLGMRTGQRVLGLAEGRTAFDGLPFPTRPLYRGRPWFLPAAVAWYRWRDRLDCRRAGAAPSPGLP
jgi:glycine/D-amino acid oxidase-like deaminating enzyme